MSPVALAERFAESGDDFPPRSPAASARASRRAPHGDRRNRFGESDLSATSRLYLLMEEIGRELRGSLSVATDYARLLRDECCGPVNQDQRDALELVIERDEDAGVLLDSLQQVVRLHAGVREADPRTCSAEEIVWESRLHLVRAAAVRRIDFIEFAPPRSPHVRCDPPLAGAALVALCRLALRRSDGTPPLLLRVSSGEVAGCVSVGIGYSGRLPPRRHRRGIIEQLETTDPFDPAALDIAAGLAHEFARHAGATISVRGGHFSELAMHLPIDAGDT
ncbi:MAG: hypothetical protein WD066_14575 [Planctomycetaceae bacterium]